MAKKFTVRTVLTAISGQNISKDFSEVFELYWYVFGDSTINDSGLLILRQQLFQHLVKQYKELAKAKYYAYTQFYMLEQKYGEYLEIQSIKEMEENQIYKDKDDEKINDKKKK